MTTLTAGAEFDGERLDRFLAAQPGVGTRAAAERLIAAGAVTVDGEPGRNPTGWSPGRRS